LSPFIGEIAALTTALCWAFGSTFFTLSGSRIGSANVNRGRLIVAALFLSLAHLVITGTPIPYHASMARWFWLGLSGIVGFVIGDGMLFEAFVLMGPRLSMLLMSLVPIISAFLAWVFLGESLNILEMAAIATTVTGILWVVADKQTGSQSIKGKKLGWGIVCGIGGALGQTFGLVLSKKGLDGGFPALSGNIIRVLCAVVVIWAITLASGKGRAAIESFKDKKAFWALSAGSFFGPFVGVWLSLVSIKYARLGVATTLMSLTPIFLIPITRIIFKERVTVGAILGTVIAVGGVAVLLIAR
jgi:drug/metabolite transporter (DMT)-like permease